MNLSIRGYLWRAMLLMASTSLTATCEEPAPPPAAKGNVTTVIRKTVRAGKDNAVEIVEEVIAVAGPARGKAIPAGVVVRAAPANQILPDGEDPLVRQWKNQLRPTVMAELGFVRVVCDDLTPKQRSEIKAAMDESLKEVATLIAEEQRKPRPAQIVVNGVAQFVNGSQPMTDSLNLIRSALSGQLKTTLTEQQLARWRTESANRLEDRKKAAILSFLSLVDGHLYLSDEQRGQIERDLRNRWRDEWEIWIVIAATYGRNGYVPAVPVDCVESNLTDDQHVVWRGLRRINVNFRGVRNRFQELDDPWWNETPENATKSDPMPEQ